MSTEDKDEVQVLKGAGALKYGVASPAGIINYVLKRATKAPITSVGLSGNGFGQAILGVDLGRSFGSEQQLGVRVNLAGGDTGAYTRGAGGIRWIGATTADWRAKRAKLRFDFESYGVNIVEQAALLQNKPGADGRITLPRIPDPYTLLSGDWARQVGVGQNVSLRGDYKLGGAVQLRGEVGRSDADVLRRAVTRIGNYDVVTGQGTETITLIRDQRYINTYADLEASIKGEHRGFLDNLFTVGYTRNERLFNNPVTTQATAAQNMYQPVPLPAPQYPTGSNEYLPQNSADYDYFFTDSVVVQKRFRLTSGMRQINYSADDKLASGRTNVSATSFWAPALGGIFEVTRKVALYASYVKSLEETGQAPINAKNAFAVLPPAPATQKEIGIRASGARGFAATLGYFTIDRANATTDPLTKIYALNGTNAFRGLESTLGVNAGPQWSLNVGGQYMHATQQSPDDPTIDGKVPENVPRLSGNLGLAYRPRRMPGLQISGGLLYVGSRQINPQDQGTIPGTATLSLGATFSGTIDRRPLSFSLNCRNCSDKRYYSSAVNGALGVAAPRTISFSARIAGL